MASDNSSLSLPLGALRYCAAELLAAAIKRLFPTAQLLGGGSSSLGFFYDIAFTQPIDEHMLTLMEQEMFSIIKEKPEIRSMNMMRENAIDFLKHHKQPLRAEFVKTMTINIVELLQIGDFVDLCPSPHPSALDMFPVFKLLNIENSKIVLPESGEVSATRIIGTAFPNSQDLKKFLKRSESAKKRDHRIIGKELDLYSTREEVGSACWFWHPKGSVIKESLIDFWRQECKSQGYQFISTPRLLKPLLLKKTQINKFLKEEALFPSVSIEGIEHLLPQDNTPSQAILFSERPHHYLQLPIRYAEYNEIFNNDKESQLWGLFNTRTYTIDQESAFCSSEQVVEELISSLQFIDKTIRMFGFEYQWYLNARGSRFAGTSSEWSKSEQSLIEALKASGIDYKEGGITKAIFGPRVEVCLVDALGREWPGPYVGIDLNLPESLGLKYQSANGAMLRPHMITRSVFGPLERFIAVLVEHTAGYFPMWLAPEQIRIIPVKDKNTEYAKKVQAQCENSGFRSTVDLRRETMGEKVYSAERDRVPYLLIVGDKEEKNSEVTVRRSQYNDNGSSVRLDQMLAQLRHEVDSKGLK